MTSLHLGRFGVIGVAAVAIAGCGAVGASSNALHSSRVAATLAGTGPSPVAARIDHLLAIAERQYAGQVHGTHSIQTLHSVGRDPTLLRLLASRNPGAARAYIAREYRDVWYHWHVSRMRITERSRVVSEVGVPFVLPASDMTLRGAGGRDLGTLAVSMQDEIGFVRLMHREYPKLQVVIRSRRTHQLRTSMYSAAFVKLPSTGSVRIERQRYLVRSFHERDWSGQPVTIWLLMRSRS